MRRTRSSCVTKEDLREVIEDKPLHELKRVNQHLWELRQMVAVIGAFVTRPGEGGSQRSKPRRGTL